MTHQLAFRRIASREIEDAAEYYENQAHFLGHEFVNDLGEVFDRLRENPFIYAIDHGKIRAAPARRFPYVVYFRIDGQRVIVLGVVHGSRDPAVWRDRT